VTHVLIAAVTFDDGLPSDRSYLASGTYEECVAAGELVPGVAYAGNRKGGQAALIVREVADADRCVVLCRFMVGTVVRDAGAELAAALPMVGVPARDAITKICDAMSTYLNIRATSGEIVGYSLGAGSVVRSDDGAQFVHMTVFLQADDTRAVRWDGLIDRAGALAASNATYEPPFLVSIGNDPPPACATCKRAIGTNPGCMTCLEHASTKGP